MLARTIQEMDATANLLLKQKSALVANLEEMKGICENEAKERAILLAKYRFTIDFSKILSMFRFTFKYLFFILKKESGA